MTFWELPDTLKTNFKVFVIKRATYIVGSPFFIEIIIKLENITLDYLYKRLQNLTYNGFFGYKHISKQISPDRYNSYILIENNPNIPSKSQLQPRVLSKLFNRSEDNEHYNWKILDTDSENWTIIQKQHIENNRKAYQDFYDRLKNANLVI